MDEREWKWPGHGSADRSPAEHSLTGAYRLLWLLLVVCVAAVIMMPGNRWVDQFGPNAATEVLGIIITLAFVQQLLYRQERARRMRSAIGAYRRAGWALSGHVEIWSDTIKGCHQGEELPTGIARLFAPHFTEVLADLDPRTMSAGEEPAAWSRKLGAEVEAATSQLNRVVLSYSSVLDPAYTEAVDEIIDHPFVKLIGDLAHAEPDPVQWRAAMNRSRGHREDFFSHLLTTVRLHNELAAEAATVRSRSRAPRTGTLGMELARDHDLHVPEERSSHWRTMPPRHGELTKYR